MKKKLNRRRERARRKQINSLMWYSELLSVHLIREISFNRPAMFVTSFYRSQMHIYIYVVVVYKLRSSLYVRPCVRSNDGTKQFCCCCDALRINSYLHVCANWRRKKTHFERWPWSLSSAQHYHRTSPPIVWICSKLCHLVDFFVRFSFSVVRLKFKFMLLPGAVVFQSFDLLQHFCVLSFISLFFENIPLEQVAVKIVFLSVMSTCR